MLIEHVNVVKTSPAIALGAAEHDHVMLELGADLAGAVLPGAIREDLPVSFAAVATRIVDLLDSTEPCASVSMSISSLHLESGSTVGQEAAFLIEGFRTGYYPPNKDV